MAQAATRSWRPSNCSMTPPFLFLDSSTMFYEPLPHARCTRVLRILEATPEEESKLTVTLSTLDLSKINGEEGSGGLIGGINSAGSERDSGSESGSESGNNGEDDNEDDNGSYSEGDYDALSYTWGSPFSEPEELEERYTKEFDAQITVIAGSKRGNTNIGRNLYEALCHIWATGRRRFLWVDALCINQADLVEKSTHVQFMGHVFSQAKRVIIWFGIDDPDLPTFGHVEFLARVWRNPNKVPVIAWSMSPENFGPQEGEDELQFIFPREAVKSLFRFLGRRRYLSRAWILQEVALGKECLILLGDHYMESGEFFVLKDCLAGVDDPRLREYGPMEELSGIGIGLGALSSFPARIAQWGARRYRADDFGKQILAHYGAHDETTDFLALLDFHITGERPNLCENPLDGLYALFGYLGAIVPLENFPIEINYQQNTETVYISATVQMLEALPHYTILSAVCGGSTSVSDDMPKLPSWVPDYRHRPVAPPILHRALRANDSSWSRPHLLEGGRREFIPDFRAGFDDSRYPPPIFNGKELSIHARYCGKLSVIKRPTLVMDRNAVLVNYFEVLISILEVCIVCREMQPGGQSHTLIEALFQVTCLPSPLLGCNLNIDFGLLIFKTIMNILSFTMTPDSSFFGLTQLEDYCLIEASGVRPKHYFISAIQGILELGSQPCLPTPSDILWMSDQIEHGLAARRDQDESGWKGCEYFQDDERQALNDYWRNSALFITDHRHSIFVTENRSAGMIANEAEGGDELWLICNARVPFLMRPTADGKYILVGEALVDEAMQGELIANGIAGEPQRITLV
ncbi:heterokaryon incompatibility protein-domain-containing protein [Xylariomycetidae sp. FL2044]|nr:heterokaryon incompatibility protein-domain-containing protein [Xylariomycetidae sp. FL2044]